MGRGWSSRIVCIEAPPPPIHEPSLYPYPTRALDRSGVRSEARRETISGKPFRLELCDRLPVEVLIGCGFR